MTVTDESTTAVALSDAKFSYKSDTSQNFLRAARAGNLHKVLDILNNSNVDVHSCNTNGLNALHLASKEGHRDVVCELLSRGADPNRATKKGNTALHIASLAGQFEVVKILLESGASVNLQAQNGFTPLYMAAQENHLEVVKLLLHKHANPALSTDDGFTPLAVALQQGHDRIVALLLENDSCGKVCLPALHIAAKKDDVKAANLLLNSEVNVDQQTSSGFTPLHIAAHYGNVNMTELLIGRGANINFQAKNNITPLHVACKWGNHSVAEHLVNAGAELDCRTRDGLTPLHCAARSGHDLIVQLLLGVNANFSAKTKSGLNAMHMAAQGDHMDAAFLLLQRGVPADDVTIDYLTALHVAAHCGNIQVAKLLLERGCDVNARALNGFTPLHIACQKNRYKIVELLLKFNCMLEATTESGLTPLHVASFMGHLNIVVLLLQHGANPNAPTIRSETALHLATRATQADVARLLLRNGAQVDARARGHQTALHIASRIGNAELVSLLIEHSAYIQAATKDTYTSLHLAAKSNHADVCELLLRAGASLDSVTQSGFTPLHLACKHTHPAVTAALLSHGANVNVVGRNGLTPLHLTTHYGSYALVQSLLEHQANPMDHAKNGFTPLHIAAEKRHLEIAKLLILATGRARGCNMESRNGFTPLHLACQAGSSELTHFLLESGAKVNARAKNGLTPMHLAAQEDSLDSAKLLAASGAELDAKTKAGYTPLHTACHFGQTNMVRFLLGKGVDVNAETVMGSNALHLAAQQGHAKVVYILLESGANPNMRNKYKLTPAHIARHQHYLNIFEVLRRVTTCVESWEIEEEVEYDHLTVPEARVHPSCAAGGGRHLLEQPDLMGDHPVTDTEEEFVEPDYTVIPASPLFGRPADRTDQHIHLTHKTATRGAGDRGSTMSGEDSIHEHVHAEAGINGFRETAEWAGALGRPISAIGTDFGTTDWDFKPDNVPITRKPITSGFLVSFLVDARGGSMRGSRHPGLRIFVPPSAASAPTRITCRMLRPERTMRPPQLNDSEGFACRIIELGPHPCTFNSPVLLEVPHFAALRGRQRELVILRSDNAETWREHMLEATDQSVQSALGQSFEKLETSEELRDKRIVRVLLTEFPQYLAIVSRLRQETSIIGSDGGVLSSTVVPQVQAVFPEGALQKRIRVGLQAQPIPQEMVYRALGNLGAVSPIVTLEPRRRKFHKPITLTIPLPKNVLHGMQNPDVSDLKSQMAPSLRLLCSITGGTAPAQWEDITGSTPLSKVKDCVSFTTTVSARFWLLDCQIIQSSTDLASHLYREANLVPYMSKFVVFTKRLDADEALIRCFCVTDDKVDKTLECQEGFEVCAASPEVEVVEGRAAWLESAGNLLPVAKSGEQPSLEFNAFRENRLAFPVRLRDMQAEPSGKLAFMREPRSAMQTTPTNGPADASQLQKPICTLEVNIGNELGAHDAGSTMADLGLVSMSDQLNTSTAASLHSIPCVFPQEDEDETEDGKHVGDSFEQRWVPVYASDVIARSQLDLLQVAVEVGADWPRLVPFLLPESGLDTNCTVERLVDWVVHCDFASSDSGFIGLTAAELRTDRDQALAVLLVWKELRGEEATGNDLERALRVIGRVDVVKSCMLDIRCVTEEAEHAEAKARIDRQPSVPQPEELQYPEANSVSIVGTDTLMSGMMDETQAGVKPDDIVVKHEEVDVQEFPIKSDEPSAEDDELIVDDGIHWQSDNAPAPANTTSQQGGDPLLMNTPKELIDGADADFVRDSESMTTSMDGLSGEVVGEEISPSVSVSVNSGVPEMLLGAVEEDGTQVTPIMEPVVQATNEQAPETSPLSDMTNLSLEQSDEVIDELDLESEAATVSPHHHLTDAHHNGGEAPSMKELDSPMIYFTHEGGDPTDEQSTAHHGAIRQDVEEEIEETHD